MLLHLLTCVVLVVTFGTSSSAEPTQGHSNLTFGNTAYIKSSFELRNSRPQNKFFDDDLEGNVPNRKYLSSIKGVKRNAASSNLTSIDNENNKNVYYSHNSDKVISKFDKLRENLDEESNRNPVSDTQSETLDPKEYLNRQIENYLQNLSARDRIAYVVNSLRNLQKSADSNIVGSYLESEKNTLEELNKNVNDLKNLLNRKRLANFVDDRNGPKNSRLVYPSKYHKDNCHVPVPHECVDHPAPSDPGSVLAQIKIVKSPCTDLCKCPENPHNNGECFGNHQIANSRRLNFRRTRRNLKARKIPNKYKNLHKRQNNRRKLQNFGIDDLDYVISDILKSSRNVKSDDKKSVDKSDSVSLGASDNPRSGSPSDKQPLNGGTNLKSRVGFSKSDPVYNKKSKIWRYRITINDPLQKSSELHRVPKENTNVPKYPIANTLGMVLDKVNMLKNGEHKNTETEGTIDIKPKNTENKANKTCSHPVSINIIKIVTSSNSQKNISEPGQNPDDVNSELDNKPLDANETLHFEGVNVTNLANSTSLDYDRESIKQDLELIYNLTSIPEYLKYHLSSIHQLLTDTKSNETKTNSQHPPSRPFDVKKRWSDGGKTRKKKARNYLQKLLTSEQGGRASRSPRHRRHFLNKHIQNLLLGTGAGPGATELSKRDSLDHHRPIYISLPVPLLDSREKVKNTRDSPDDPGAAEPASDLDSSLNDELGIDPNSMRLSSGCNNSDFMSANRCICLPRDALKDLYDDRADVAALRSYCFDCSRFVKIEPGLVIDGRSARRDPADKRERDFGSGDEMRRRVSHHGGAIARFLSEDCGLADGGSTVHATPGMSVEVPCVGAVAGADADADAATSNYTWSRSDGSPIIAGRVLASNRSLVLESVSAQDAANYTCAPPSGPNKSGALRYRLDVVALPVYTLITDVAVRLPESCGRKHLDLIRQHYAVLVEQLLCAGPSRLCRVDVANALCSDEGTLTFQVVLMMEPLGALLPQLDLNACALRCQYRLYATLAGVTLRNLLSVTGLPVVFRLAGRRSTLDRVPVADGDPNRQLQSFLFLSCTAGFGMHDHPKLCYPCEPYTVNAGGASYCARCPFGTYQPETGARNCIACTSALQDPSCIIPVAMNLKRSGVVLLVCVLLLVPVLVGLALVVRVLVKRKGKERRSGGQQVPDFNVPKRSGSQKGAPQVPPIDF